MNAQRFGVADQVWRRLEPHLPGKALMPGRGQRIRLSLQAVFWRGRTGSPWRYSATFRSHLKTGTLGSVGFAVGPRQAYSSVFSKPQVATPTLNRRSSTAPSFRFTGRRPAQKGTQHQAIGRARRPDDQDCRPGRCARQSRRLPAAARASARHEGRGSADTGRTRRRAANKAFDVNWLLEELDERGATSVIPPASNRRHQRDDDADACKGRYLVENHFAKIRKFRGMATRYDKTDCSSAANLNLAATLIASR